MIRTEDGLAPRRLTSRDMAQVLAAIVARRPEVADLVSELSPTHGAPLLEELDRLVRGDVAPDDASVVLRWVLPEIHAELGRDFAVVCA